MFKNWIKIAFRNFAKNKLATFIKIFGLTVGLVGLVLTLLYWTDQNSYDNWNPDKDNIYTLSHGFGGEIYGTSYPHIEKAKETISEVEDALVVQGNYIGENISLAENSIYETKILISSANFFDFFPFEIISGNPKTALSTKNYAALSEELALKLFGKTEVTGKAVKIGNSEFLVSAVYSLDKKSFFMPKAVIPFQNEYNMGFNNFNYFSYLKLKPETDIEAFKNKYEKNVLDYRLEQDLQGSGLTVQEFKDKNEIMYPVVIPLSDVHFKLKMPWTPFEPLGNLQLITIMFGLSMLILILSIVNFINLTTANAIKRAKEIGVRKALGATKTNIIYQFLTETAIIAAIALLLTSVAIEILLPYFNEFLNVDLKISFGEIFFQLLLTIILVILITGAIPAFYLSNYKAIYVLKGVFSRSKNGIIIRNTMLFLQFVIATFFIIGTLMVYLQIQFMNRQDLGLNKEQVVILGIGNNEGNAYAKYEKIKHFLEKQKGIVEVNATRPTTSLEAGASSTDLEFNEEKSQEVTAQTIDMHYPEMMEMKLLKGRFLSFEFASDTVNNIVINETLARELKIYDDPINKKLKGGQKKSPLDYNVVGMVKDYHIGDVQSEIGPAFMYHWKAGEDWMPLYSVAYVQVKFDAAYTPQVIEILENYWQAEIAPGYPFDYHFMDESFAKTYEQYTKQQQIFLILTFVVIFIALLGLFALSSLLIEQKMKEVAVRKTLGASSNRLIFGFSKQYLIIGGAASLVTMPLAYFAVSKWLEDFAYRINIPLWPFLISFVGLLLLAFLVVSIKAWRATKIDLVKYLKYE